MASGVLLFVYLAAWRCAVGMTQDCNASSFPVDMKNTQMMVGNLTLKNTTADACLQNCCSKPSCVAWNYHVSSTDPSHHPAECWITDVQHPIVKTGESSDTWVGGSRYATAPYVPPGEGATIQPLSSWFYYGKTGSDTLLRELTDQSIALLRKRAAKVASVDGSLAWKARVSEAKRALSEVFSPLPPTNRTAPTFKVVDTLRRPSYTCEKILYETRPGFWVTAALWTPAGLAGSKLKAPGVLLVSGHTMDGFRSNNLGGPLSDNAAPDDDYQVVEINLVARGFVVLAFDPIGQGERLQYADIPIGAVDPSEPHSKGGPGSGLWGSTADHEYIGRQLLLNGVGLMSFWLHDETASMDLLAGLPHVDASALGVAGCSGGGTQSSYLGAMDPRVKAASMACYMSTFEIDRLWAAGGGSDGEQTWPHGVHLGLDKPDLIEARADQATQVLITTADTCFPAAGGFAAVEEARSAYDALGGTLDVYPAVWHHGWVQPTREQVSKFFCESLAPGFTNKSQMVSCANSSEIDVSKENVAFMEWNDKQLQVTSTGQVVTAPECGATATHPAKTVHDFTVAITQSNLKAVALRRRSNASSFLKDVRKRSAAVSGFLMPEKHSVPRFLGAQFVSPHPPGPPHPGYPPQALASMSQVSDFPDIGLVERWMIPGEGSCFSVVTLYFPASVQDLVSARAKLEVIVWYRRSAAEASAPSAAVSKFTAKGYIVAMPELCGFGEAGDAFDDGLFGKGQASEDMAHEIGRSVPGIQAGDIVRVHQYLRKRRDVASIKLAVSQDHIDVALMHAAMAVDATQTPTRLALVAPRASLAAAALERLYSPVGYYGWIVGILKEYDVADCVAAIVAEPPTSMLVLGPVDHTLKPLSDGSAKLAYKFAIESASSPNHFSLIAGNFSEELAADNILEWIGDNARPEYAHVI